MTADLHKEAIVVAAHTDIIGADVDYHRIAGKRAVFEERHVPILRKGGVTVFLDHLGGDSRYAFLPATSLTTTPMRRVMRMIDHAHREAEESSSIILVDTVEDIHRAKREGKIAMVLCLEGASPLEDDVAYLRNLHRLGLRSLGLTHNWRNQLADGVLERSGGGLTHFGVEVVRECNRLGVIVDVSHLSDRGLEDVLAVSQKPIIASHSNCKAIRPHVRNLADAQIRGIAERGGVIGVHALNTLVGDTPQPPLSELLRHIQHLANVGGIDCVGLGPDLLENWQEDIFKAVTEGAPSFLSVPVKKMSYSYPVGMSSLGDTPNITRGLVELGWKRDDILKVLGGNFMRLFAEAWPARPARRTAA
jgi:membrane dipeptidase